MAVVVPIVGDFSGLTRALAGSQRSLTRFGKVAALAVGAALTAELYKSVKAAADAEKSTQALRQQLKSLGKAGDVDRLTQQFTRLAETLGVDDEAAARAYTTILRLTGDSTKAMDGLNLALDLSANKGFADLEKQAMVVGRAINGNTRLFKQFGITIDENTTLQEGLAIVQKRVSGQAVSYGQSAIGSFQRYNEAVENLRETIGGPLVIALASAAGKLSDFVSAISAKPTLEAKVKLVIGRIGNVAWRGIQSVYEWWTTQGRVELPARVVLIPSGKQQFEAFYQSIRKRANDFGYQAGAAFAGFFIGAFSSEGRAKIGTALSGIFGKLRSVTKFLAAYSGMELAGDLISGFAQGIRDTFANTVGLAIREALYSALKQITGPLPAQAEQAIMGIFGFGPRSRRTLANRITSVVRQAIQDARGSLAGMGESVVGMIGQIRGAQARPGGMMPAAMTAEARAIEDARFKIEEDRLKAAASAVGATEEDKLALREFYLQKEQTLRDRYLADQEAKDKKSIDDLVERFNQGLITAKDFSAGLDKLIGKDRGESLGIGFAGAFAREVSALKTLVADIFGFDPSRIGGGVGTPLGSMGGRPVTEAVKAENERRYGEYVQRWEATRDRLLSQISSARGIISDETKTDAQRAKARKDLADLKSRLAQHRKDRLPRSAFGLALGGILKRSVIAGEAGKEAVIPLHSTSAMNILRDAIGTSGGGGSTTINLTVNAGLGTNPDELSRVIVESIKRFEKRNGSVFESPGLTVTANTSGKSAATQATASDFNRTRRLRRG